MTELRFGNHYPDAKERLRRIAPAETLNNLALGLVVVAQTGGPVPIRLGVIGLVLLGSHLGAQIPRESERVIQLQGNGQAAIGFIIIA